MNTELSPIFSKARRRAVTWFVLGVILLVGGSLLSADRFAQAYLFGFIFWFLFTVGGLACLMLHHMVAGAWSFLTQRIAEAAARNIVVMIVLFIPIAFFFQSTLYPWHPDHALQGGAVAAAAQQDDHAAEEHAEEDHGEGAHAEEGHSDEGHAAHGDDHHGDHHAELMVEFAQKKAWYLNSDSWLGRAILYFAILLGLTYYLTSASRRLDNGGPDILVRRMRRVSSVGMCIFFLVMTFATTDWTMSLDPTFFSTMYAPTFIVAAGISILALNILTVAKLKNYQPLSGVYNIELAHHLGNLLLGFTVLWAYTNFSQYLIIYSGNLSEEIPYYLGRDEGGLLEISIFLMTFHFGVPFVILLWRRAKRPIGTLKIIASWMIIMRFIDLYWVVMPNFHRDTYQWASVIACLGAVLMLGGIWWFFFHRNLEKHPLLSANDPRQLPAFAKWEGMSHHA